MAFITLNNKFLLRVIMSQEGCARNQVFYLVNCFLLGWFPGPGGVVNVTDRFNV